MAVKIKDIAKQQGFDQFDFERFMESVNQKEIKVGGFLESTINENDVQRAIELYREEQTQKNAKKEEARRQKEQAEKEKQLAEIEMQQTLSRILVTSGFNFEGYEITKYSEFISGDGVISMPRTSPLTQSNNVENLTYALKIIRKQAINQLRKKAYDLGCNAVIGVDSDYITLDPQTANIDGGTTYESYVVCVTLNGTAVKIEKIATTDQSAK